MLKMFIDNEEVISKNDFTIKEEMLSASSTILNNTYPKTWEQDHDYTTRFYYPKDYAKLDIQKFTTIQEEEAGSTIQVNGSATLSDVDAFKESRILRLLGQTSQTGTPTPDSPIPVNVVSGDNEINICGKNLAKMKNGTYSYGNNTGVITDNNIMTLNTNGSGSNSYFSFGNGYTQQWAPNGTGIDAINDLKLTSDGGTYTATIETNRIVSGASITLYFFTNATRSFSKRIDGNTTTTISISLNDGEHIKDFGIWGNSATIYSNYEIKVMLEKGSSSTTYEPYIGNTYPIYLGETGNQFVASDLKQGAYNSTTNTARVCWFGKKVSTGDVWNITCNNSNLQFATARTSQNDNTSSNTISQDSGWQNSEYTITSTGDGYVFLVVRKANSSAIVPSDVSTSDFTITYGHKTTQSIELCKIGTYQDYIYKEDDKWYLYKEIGKAVLDGSESWNISNSGTSNWYYISNIASKLLAVNFSPFQKMFYSNQYVNAEITNSNTITGFNILSNSTISNIRIRETTQDTTDNFKTRISKDNIIVYAPLQTPTTTEITDTTLINQLDNLASG